MGWGVLDYDSKAFSTLGAQDPVINSWLKWLNDDQVSIHKCSHSTGFLNQQNQSSLPHQRGEVAGQGMEKATFL